MYDALNNKAGILVLVTLSFLLLYTVFLSPNQSHTAFTKISFPQECHFQVDQYGPFESSGLGENHVGVLCAYLIAIALCGLPLTRWAFPKGEYPFFLLLGAAYLPGYLLTIAFVRLVTIVLPNSIAPNVTLFSIFSIGALSFLYFCFQESEKIRTSWPKRIGPEMVSASFLGLLFLGSLVGQAQMSEHCFSGDSTRFFLDNIVQQKKLDPDTTKLPFVNQHYDELMFSYPIVFGSPSHAIPLFAIWLNSAASKVSITFALFIVLKQFAVSIPIAFTFCLYILVGTWALNPFKYFIYFDSGTPQILNFGGMGRMLSIVLPWFLFFHFSSVSTWKTSSRFQLASLGICAFLLGWGVTATSIHNAVFTLIFSMVFLIYRDLWVGEGGIHTEVVRIPLFREIVVISILGMLCAYSFGPTILQTFGGGIFFILLCYAGILLLKTLLQDGFNSLSRLTCKLTNLSSFVPVGSFLCGIFLGLSVGGNIFFGKFYSKLATAFSIEGLPEIIERIAGSPHAIFKIFSSPDYLAYSPAHHNIGPYDSLIAFLEYFAPMLIAAIVILYWMETAFQRDDPCRIPIPKLFFYVVLAVSIFLFAASNFLKDFIQYIFEPHHLTRLLEYPFYLILTAFVIMASHYLQGRSRVILTLLTILWILIPFTNHPILQQWQINATRVFG